MASGHSSEREASTVASDRTATPLALRSNPAARSAGYLHGNAMEAPTRSAEPSADGLERFVATTHS
jgi:hypothetical protein